MPKRVKLSRVKGWRMPPNTVKVSRPSKWGNPCRVGTQMVESAEEAVDGYRHMLLLRDDLDPEELRGKDLACWCPLGRPCHADVLLEIANAPTSAAAAPSSHPH